MRFAGDPVPPHPPAFIVFGSQRLRYKESEQEMVDANPGYTEGCA